MTYHEASGGIASTSFLSAWPSAADLIPSSYCENRQVRLADFKPTGRLGRYHILRKYEGGMGEVYVCLRDMEEPQPPIALKTFRSKFSFDSVARRAFQRECALWARASLAPNVLPIWGMEEIDGRAFILMAGVLPGTDREVTLDDLMVFKPPSVPLTLCFARMIAGSLAMASRTVPGLVHGDLKPSNILMMWPNLPYISDFGLARIAQQGLHGDALRPDLTYCSPNAKNSTAVLTVLDDVYSYGRIVEELLTSSANSRQAYDEGNPDERMLAERVRAELSALARQCCAPEPYLRPRDFGEIYSQLEMMVPNDDWHFPPGLNHFPNPEVRPQRLRMVAQTLLQLKTYDIGLDFFASIRHDWLDWQLQAGQGIAYLGTGKPIKALHVLEKAGTARRQERWDPDLTRDLAQISYLCAGAHIMMHSYRGATRILQRLIDHAPNQQIRSDALYSLVNICIERRHYKQAEWLLLEKRTDKDSADYWHQLGLIYLRLCDWPQAVEAFRRALKFDPLSSMLHSHLGQALAGIPDRTTEALVSFNRAADCGDLAPETFMFSLACANRLADDHEIDRLSRLIERHFEHAQTVDIQRRAAQLANRIESGTVPAYRRARGDVRWERRMATGRCL